MLKEFKIRNFKSFKDEQVLSLEPMNKREEELDYFNIAEIGKNRILKTAAIYGHNSFGKSNILKGLGKMISIIRSSANQEYKLQVDNFKLNEESKNLSSMFEISFLVEGITYRYGFEVLKNKISSEWLFRKKEREVKVFKRNTSLNTSIEINTSDESILKKFVEFTRENELFLSSMIKNNIDGEIKKIYEFISKSIKIVDAGDMTKEITSSLILDKMISKEKLLQGLKNADLGIIDFEILEKKNNFLDLAQGLMEVIRKNVKSDINIDKEEIISIEEKIQHNIYDNNKEVVGSIGFDITESESEGTIKFYSILGPVLHALDKGTILFIDELDSRLQHNLVKYIVELFHDLEKNKNNAQLIFNTHDFYLLKEELFRRDQIYFVNKNKFGESNLDSLGDFKGLDKKANIMAHFLAGNFGALGNIKLVD